MKHTRVSSRTDFLSSWICLSIIIICVWSAPNNAGCQALISSSTAEDTIRRSSLSSRRSTITALSSSSSSSSSPIPPPPALSVPVWSLATTTAKSDDNTAITATNMNIMTYCMPVSIGPPKLWALSIFKETLTREIFFKTKIGILQLLTKDQSALVSILGKQSGKDVDKAQACAKVGYKWAEPSKDVDSHVLPSCSLYLQVQMVDSEPMMDAGDHWVVLCQVINTGQWNAEDHCIQWRTSLLLDDSDNKNPPPMKPIDGIGDNAMYSGWLRQEGHL